jgi:ketosteroid isomerase-like protein
MQPIRRALLAVLLILGAGAALAQPENPALRKEIQEVYAMWDKFVAKKDVEGAIGMLHPTFISIDKNGRTTNYEQVTKTFRSMMGMFRDPKMKIVVDQIQEQGAEVVAWVSMSISFKMKQGDKWVPASHKAKFAETLKKFDGEWKFVASQELP